MSTEAPRPYVDQAKAWMCYMSFAGDLEKTSISSGIPLVIVKSLEHDFDWPRKMKKLRAGAGVADAEKTVNRAVNYIQSQRMRDLLERALRYLEDEEALLKQLVKFRFTKEGEVERIEVNPKAILDLTKALEACQNMSYRALGDKVPAQADPVDEKEKGVAASMVSVRNVILSLSDLKNASRREIEQVVAPAVAIPCETKPIETEVPA